MVSYSVIINTRNGSKRIIPTLYSLLRQSINPLEYEIIVVNDGSTDDTQDVLQKFKQENGDRKIRICNLKGNRGVAQARNQGIKMARGTIIFFTDDDVHVPALWMEKYLEIYKKNPEVAGVCGWTFSPIRHVHRNIFEQFIYITQRLNWGMDIDFFEYKTGDSNATFKSLSPPFIKGMVPTIHGGNMSFKKIVLDNIAGFNESIPGAYAVEDVELGLRVQTAGYIMYYSPFYITHFQDVMNLRKFTKYVIKRSRGKNMFAVMGLGKKPRSGWDSFRRFTSFTATFKNQRPDVPYKKSVWLIALYYYMIDDLISRLPNWIWKHH